MEAPLINISKWNWLSMRVGVMYCKLNTTSRNIIIKVIILKDLYLKRSMIVNVLVFWVDLLRN